MAKKTIMRSFLMREISGVDRPAQAHAKKVIMKRDARPAVIASDPGQAGQAALVPFFAKFGRGVVEILPAETVTKDMYGVSRFAELIQSINYLAASAEYESEQEGDHSPVPAALRSWLKTGTDVFRAMADEEVRELIAAVSAVSKRATAPPTASMPDGSYPIATAADLAHAMKLAGHAPEPTKARAHIKRRAQALGLESKLSAEKSAEFAEACAKALETAPDLLAGMSPAELTKAILADLGDAQSKETVMPKTVEELTKALADSEAARVAAEEALAVAKKDSPQEDQDGDTKKPAFPKKKPAKNPDPQADDDDAKKALDALPESVKKALAEGDDLRKRLATLEDEREGVAFGKRATTLGLHETHGEILRKAYKGDAEAIGKLESIIKGLTAQVEKGALFSELGKGGGGPATAKAEMDGKVEAYRTGQIAVGKKLSTEQAFVTVYTDPANADLKKRFDAETGKIS